MWTERFSTSPRRRARFLSRTRCARHWDGSGSAPAGAVAFVSGRPVNELDLIFSPLQLPAIGGHGAELRTIAGAAPESPRLPPLDPSVKRQFAAIAEAGPGIILEDKGYSLALHYRLAPEKERMVREAAARIVTELKATADRTVARQAGGGNQADRFHQGDRRARTDDLRAIRRPPPRFSRRRR